MTVSSEISKIAYAGDGETTEFPVPFYFLANDEVKVVHKSGAGVEITWVEGTHYELTGAGAPGGGTLTVETSPTNYTPLTGEQLVIKRDLGFVQETDYPEGGQFPARAHEQALDRLVMLCQQLCEEISRTLQLAETSSIANVTVPEPAAGKALVWNAEQDGLENSANSVDEVVATAAASAAAAAASASSASASASAAADAETNAETAEANAEAAQAAAEAAASQAAATLASALWRDVVHLTSEDSPRSVTSADNGKLLVCDTTAGAVVIDLPTIVSVGEPFNVSIKWEAGANSLTVNRGGTDAIDGAISYVFDSSVGAIMLIADVDSSPDQWEVVEMSVSNPVTFETLPLRARTAARLALHNLTR